MEALVVVAIIAITAALAAPALSRTMADRRAVEATQLVVRIGARARSESMAYGRAYLLRFTQVSSGASSASDGSLELWRGSRDRCTANDWGTLVTGACSADTRCTEEVDMGRFDYTTHRVRLRLVGATSGDLCFEPNGEMFIATIGGFESVPPTGADAVRFNVSRLESGALAGVTRAVVFPFGGTPRILR